MVDLSNFFSGIGEAILGGILPIIAAMGAITAMISLRNSDVATRSRNIIDELIYKLPALK
jgi:hypothetical protein